MVAEGAPDALSHSFVLMSSRDYEGDTHDSTTANNSDKLVPTYPDKTRIIHDGNLASISGILEEWERWNNRNRYFTLLIKFNAMRNKGKIIRDDRISNL